MAWIRSDSAQGRDTQTSMSVISVGTHFEGRIVSDAAVLVEGTLEGDIQASHLHIGAAGAVTGNISATDVTILGSMEGDIRAENIRLGTTARVRADILHGSMEIAPGARFAGRAMRSVQPPRALPALTQSVETEQKALELFPSVVATLHMDEAEPVPVG